MEQKINYELSTEVMADLRKLRIHPDDQPITPEAPQNNENEVKKDDDDSEWTTDDSWSDEEDNEASGKKDQSRELFMQMQREYERKLQQTGEMHQVLTSIDGKTIEAKCVRGLANFYFCPWGGIVWFINKDN